MNPHWDLKQAADNLYWCLEDRYSYDGDNIIKGTNEVVSFYSQPNEEEGRNIAVSLDALVAPVRRRRARELLAKMEDLMAAVRSELST